MRVGGYSSTCCRPRLKAPDVSSSRSTPATPPAPAPNVGTARRRTVSPKPTSGAWPAATAVMRMSSAPSTYSGQGLPFAKLRPSEKPPSGGGVTAEDHVQERQERAAPPNVAGDTAQVAHGGQAAYWTCQRTGAESPTSVALVFFRPRISSSDPAASPIGPRVVSSVRALSAQSW